MAKRKIIKINEAKCTGCGLCIPNCPEGAIQIINKKARLIGDLFCDGLGACLGNCPEGAISIEEREATKYNERKVMENIVKQGEEVIKAHLNHLKEHNQKEYLDQALKFLKKNNLNMEFKETAQRNKCGCPGKIEVDMRKKQTQGASPGLELNSELNQWPIQLHLLNPDAPYFADSDLVFAADCTAFSYADFHRRFLKGKILIIFCPKLDKANEDYIEKISAIFKNNDIKSITLVHMEVPCCFGLVNIIKEAIKVSNKNNIIKDYTISIKGEIV